LNICEMLASKFHVECCGKGSYIYVKAMKEDYVKIAEYLRNNGFKRLLTVSAIDWISKGVFEIYFIAYNFESNVYVKVSIEIPREKPEIDTLSTVWENASMHEREVWELFGVTFKGNSMLKPLFLEDWKELPPFRKDFDWRKYVAKEYGLKYPPTPRLIPPKKR